MRFEVTHGNKILTLVEASPLEKRQLKLSLTKKLEYYRFLPQSVKNNWDGIISYFHKDKYVPVGLWKELKDICKEHDFKIQIDGLENIFFLEYSEEYFNDWVNELFKDAKNDKGEPFIPRDYQIDTAYKILTNKLAMSELTTSAGKSLIIFICIAFFQEHKISEKFLMIVPSIDLVIQAYEDFNEYNSFLLEENKIPLNIKQIHGGEKKDFLAKQNIHISTFQSLANFQDNYFTAFDTIVIDECLHPDSLINMADGSTKKIKDVVIGDKVWTTNDKTGEKQIREVEFVYKNLSKHEYIYELEMLDGSILELTGNHKVKLSDFTYKRVDELDGTEDIISFND